MIKFVKNQGMRTLLLTITSLVLMQSYINCGNAKNGFDKMGRYSSPSTGTTNNSSTGGGSGTGPTPTPTPSVSAGQLYYQNTITPLFNNRCITCHTEPRFGGQGPLSIYGYSLMKTMLNNGTSATNNMLINKVQNIIAHTGGNQCTGGISTTPCQEIVQWWQIENGSTGSAIAGAIDDISDVGVVYGWAKNISNPTATINVHIYIDGPVGTGTLVATILANAQGPGGQSLGHYFSYTLPDQYKNGAQHTLYAYGITAAAGNSVPGTPRIYTAYTPKAAGINYYNQTLKPMLLNRCAGCHAIDYTNHYLPLLSPPKHLGGTALTNQLIEKASGGMQHGGGNICGNKNNAPCAQMQQWWNLEFN